MLRSYSLILLMVLYLSSCFSAREDYGYGPNNRYAVVGVSSSVYLQNGEVELWSKAGNTKQMIANALSKCAGFSNCMIKDGFILTNKPEVLIQNASRVCVDRHYESTRPSMDVCLQTKEFQAFILNDSPNNEKYRWDKSGVDSYEKAIDFAICTLWKVNESEQKLYGQTAEDQRINCLLERGYAFKANVDGYNQGMGDEAKCYSIWFYSRFHEYCESPNNPIRPKGGFKNWHILYGTCSKRPENESCKLINQIISSNDTEQIDALHKQKSKSYCWFGCNDSLLLPDNRIQKELLMRQDIQNNSNRQMEKMLRDTAPKSRR